ncbi:hypothetical protein E5221_01425 [Pseudomonas sp. A2]|nr:hypothetical protein E5221_01425 [Pseudomonas sp. A2]
MKCPSRSCDGCGPWGCCAALRGHARSHRYCAGFRFCADPVGAGVPAKGRTAAPMISAGTLRQKWR